MLWSLQWTSSREDSWREHVELQSFVSEPLPHCQKRDGYHHLPAAVESIERNRPGGFMVQKVVGTYRRPGFLCRGAPMTQEAPLDGSQRKDRSGFALAK
jgi:hypothetical protein